MIDKSHTARMFTNVAFLDLTARIIGGPLMDQLLFAGNETTSPLEGSCFLLSAVSKIPPTPCLRNFSSQNSNICTNEYQVLFATIFFLSTRLSVSR